MLLRVSSSLTARPVAVKEAALDSPTFRATAVHFSDQLDLVERWLDAYMKAVARLAHDVLALQAAVDHCVQSAVPPPQVSEAIVDHDYTCLALRRSAEGARDFWGATIKGMRRTELTVVHPIRAFLHSDLRMLKDARKTLDHAQRHFDGTIARYAGQAKTKEASSLREDAFQLHEARKEYLRASMDFCVLAPQVRSTLDKLLIKVTTEQWRDTKAARDASSASLAAWSGDMDRVKGWSKEMENSERVFKRELVLARNQVEKATLASIEPSRNLDGYTASTVPYLGNQPTAGSLQSPKPDAGADQPEKQGWLFQRTVATKPARTYWVRRWFFVKSGIFGWLAQGSRSGAVEESEKTGVLLCGIRPAFQEERRFCFEVKTKDTTIVLQAETQNDLTEWISSFEIAKRRALEDTSRDATTGSQAVDAAFSISPPVAPEFAARTSEGHASHFSEDGAAMERAEALALPGADGLQTRASFDVTRRSTALDRDESTGRDHAARIMQKLDLSRKSTAGPQLSGNASAAAGGIASLISASLTSAGSTIVPVAPLTVPAPGLPEARFVQGQQLPPSSLAPSTLANPPAPTNLSKAAVAVSGERGMGLGRSGGMPGGLLANLWGSQNWGYLGKLEAGETASTRSERSASQPPSPVGLAAPEGDVLGKPDASRDPSRSASASTAHRKTMSMGGPAPTPRPGAAADDDVPSHYPLPLRMQDAQFRTLFPTVPRDEQVVLVFRAAWCSSEQQVFPGRAYVTTRAIYFYSHHLGLVLVTCVRLGSVDEVTAAPGKDCDFLYVHFKRGSGSEARVTIKTFLEPLKLLQRRLNYLVRAADAEDEHSVDAVLQRLVQLETTDGERSPSAESWEEVSLTPPADPKIKTDRPSPRVDGTLFGPPANSGRAAKTRLPAQPVVHAPPGMAHLVAESEFDIGAKALFHVLFGDKSAVFQMLYRERLAQRIVQGPWVAIEHGRKQRELDYEVALPPHSDAAVINDYQTIELLRDHLCYVVADRKFPWHLPLADRFTLLSKIVITHVSRTRCKLAVYAKVDWRRPPALARALIERQGQKDLELEAQDLVEVLTDQVQRLGSNPRTGKVLRIFGHVGVQAQAAQFAVADVPTPTTARRYALQQRSLASLVLELVGSFLVRAMSSACGSLVAVLATLGTVLSAHRLLLLLLLASGGANMFYSSRDSWQWWTERNAAVFLSRLGVGPSTTMARAVYLKDIEESFWTANGTALSVSPASTANQWYVAALVGSR